MDRGVVDVLLVGENAVEFSALSQFLEKRGGKCRFAASHAKAAQLFSERPFDLVLCTDRMADMHNLTTTLSGSLASLFCYHIFETSGWWVPAVLHGKRCLGSPALRPSDFAKVIDRMMEELKTLEPALTFSVAS